MTFSTRSPRCAALVSAASLTLLLALPSEARDPRHPLPIYIEDNHAGTFQFLASTLELDGPSVLILIDAHSDSSRPTRLDPLREGIRRVESREQREERVQVWRRNGDVQSFDWIAPLMPAPIIEVVWVSLDRNPDAGPQEEELPPGFTVASLGDLAIRVPPDVPAVVTIDLDAFSGLDPDTQAARFSAVWKEVVRLPHLEAISFAISRPWLSDDHEASRLVTLALKASLGLAHATIRFEPWGVEGPDRSEQAKAFFRLGKEPPRFDLPSASSELRNLVLAHRDRLEVRLDGGRWEELLSGWRAEQNDWHVTLSGVGPDSDRIFRPPTASLPDLRVEGGPPGKIRRVSWLRWTPRTWTYDVLPNLPAGKTFAGSAPPVIEYSSEVFAHSIGPVLGADAWLGALPGPENSGVLRVSAEVETDAGPVETARIEIRRASGEGFRAGLTEQFGLPYVFGAGFLRGAGLRGPDTGVGNDCANFLVAAWRRSGLQMPWSNPAQLRRRLARLAQGVRAADRAAIPPDAPTRGLVVHLDSHVAALWEDREPLGTLGPEDVLVHHLGGAPELITLADLLATRGRDSFDLYLGPSREPAAWIAVGGDVMPGVDTPPPPGLGGKLSAADLAVANLETTVGSQGKAVQKRYSFRIPARRLRDLREAGLAAISLANNHAGDFGPDGLVGTLAAVDAAGLGRFGAGVDLESAMTAWYTNVKGVTVAFVSVSLTDPSLLPAGVRQAGVAVLPGHERRLVDALSKARGNAQTLIVVPHWGDEGSTTVTEEQRRWARWFVEHGADAVVGSGPHVIQGQETIEGVPVFYSVGNLWFEGSWPGQYRRAGIAFLGVTQGGRVVASRLEEIEAPLAPPSFGTASREVLQASKPERGSGH